MKFAKFKSVARKIGIDRAIAYTIAGKGWTGVAGLITILLLARFLSRV
ncbi:MAG: hypothetical protein P4L33_12460 [Capsulimonadaceae bacterium]|nr:hypothetical protein [Capsulimonadaceae bacterium]